jgi:aldose sugar dehydrogenase
MKRTFISIALIFNIVSSSFSVQYTYEDIITGLDYPVAFTFLDDNKIIINQRSGISKIYNLNGQFISNFWNFTDSIIMYSETGLLGVCADPDFISNRYLYFFYTGSTPSGYKVVRITENNNIGINPLILFALDTSVSGIHAGGNLRFGPDNKLYITLGDRNTSMNAQRLYNPYGKILRINSDGSIPTDNPFYDDGNPRTGNDDRIWAYGFKNTFDFCFSPINDSIYGTENGIVGNDELNFIRRGQNYGYPHCIGYCDPYNPLYKQPATVFAPVSNSTIVTGVIIYNGNKMPELYGKALVAGFAPEPFGGIHVCDLGNSPYDSVLQKEIIIESRYATTLMQGVDGDVYLLRQRSAPNGKFQRLRHYITGINGQHSTVSFSLSQNYPNPFNPVTSIKYEIPSASFVTLKIYNVLGIEVATLVNETKQQGSYQAVWDAVKHPSGVYFYEMTAGDFKERRKMVLIK